MAVVFAHLVSGRLLPVGVPTLADGVFRVPLADTLEVTISAFTCDAPKTCDLFEFFLVKTRHQGQREYVALKQRGTGKRLGYLFPIAALAPDSEFADTWAGVFAHAAVDWVLSTDNAKDLLTISQIERITPEHSLSIVDCFEPSVGVVVFSKTGLVEAGCARDSLRLMIQEHGVRPISKRSTPPVAAAETQFEERLHLRKCSTHVAAELEQFCFLFEVADQQSYQPARLLILYQVVEAFIARVFEHAVRALVSDPESIQDVWELREQLDELSREKGRIHRLFAEYVDDPSHELHAATGRLKDACVAFLLKAELPRAPAPTAPQPATVVPLVVGATDAKPEIMPVSGPAADAHSAAAKHLEMLTDAIGNAAETVSHADARPSVEPPGPAAAEAGETQPFVEKTWADLLYRTRNVLVHRQWQLKVVPEKELSDVCIALEQLLYLAFSGFQAEPSRPKSTKPLA